jgi:biotin carboxyl carrier protein
MQVGAKIGDGALAPHLIGWVDGGGKDFRRSYAHLRKGERIKMTTEIRSEMAANVWKIEITDGAEVAAGDTIIILESMKMEIPVEAPRAGTCTLKVKEGSPVQEGDVLAVIG